MIPPPTFLLDRILARCSLRHVQVLLMAAETGTLRGAAEAVGVLPESLEQMLCGVEDLLGTELLRRDGDTLHVLPACSVLLPHARDIMASVAAAADALVVQQRDQRIVLRALADGAAARRLLSLAIPVFTARYARVHVQWREADGTDPLQAIARGEVDLVAGTRPPAVPAGWRFHRLLPDRFAAVCSPQHRLAGAARANWKELARQAWLLPPPGSAAREAFEASMARVEEAPACYCVVTDMDEVADWLVRAPELLAFVPVSSVLHLLLAGELVQLAPDPAHGEPLGLLQPLACTQPALRLAGFLQNFAENCPEAACA